jgi:hypothetical protein
MAESELETKLETELETEVESELETVDQIEEVQVLENVQPKGREVKT